MIDDGINTRLYEFADDATLSGAIGAVFDFMIAREFRVDPRASAADFLLFANRHGERRPVRLIWWPVAAAGRPHAVGEPR
jgi:hypothetical protein